ncbi:tRNA adenosine(34) deaminase TadA [Bombilactobacillus folatiphilus]|uniref:tRNA-specific adenosine deaminase n=1 Tax=Bombilactobacillus folatiphilus TaxID=2923362 RepID=A0ABY4PAT1_9LACO|nr:tRNA adenosine(34) deaminase TadA [Bombilactobacillus folatiphilus]UQS82858.1 tRNA adenosine(34) deaminase TadA [Bombilactobacillus folatiphilus]
MRQAMVAAQQARSLAEVPIGAVIVDEQTNQVIAQGFNQRETKQASLAHAELIAIEQASQRLNSWRLEYCSLFVTLEPCAMCAGAIINSRINNVVFGAWDPKAGSVGSLTNLFELPYNHRPDYQGGILESECAQLLTDFFHEIRQKHQQ